MRVTYHNARTGKDGVFNVKHNDRNFPTEHAPHIDPERTPHNISGEWTNSGLDFETAEKLFYEQHFRKALDAKNAAYEANRNKRDQKTMDEYRLSKRTCPEESIICIGKKGGTVDINELADVVYQQLKWETKQFPNVKILDYAVHADEAGAPHVHVRRVWTAKDKHGNLEVNQKRALAEMGIERPDLNKPESRYNNAKMTYTRQCREHLIALCQERGLEIETVPLEKSKTGLSLLEYQSRQEQEKLTMAQEQAVKTLQNAQEEANLQKEAILLDACKVASSIELEAETKAWNIISSSQQEAEKEAKLIMAKAKKYWGKIKALATQKAREELIKLNAQRIKCLYELKLAKAMLNKLGPDGLASQLVKMQEEAVMLRSYIVDRGYWQDYQDWASAYKAAQEAETQQEASADLETENDDYYSSYAWGQEL